MTEKELFKNKRYIKVWFKDYGWKEDRYEALTKTINNGKYRIIFRVIAFSIKELQPRAGWPLGTKTEWRNIATCYYKQMDEKILKEINANPKY